MPEYLVPGVFVEELSLLPPSVAEVETALPAFVGYTAQATLNKPGDLLNVPHRIGSLAEFEACYGMAAPMAVSRVDVDKAGNFISAQIDVRYYLYDALRLFFANGGIDCHIVSVGLFSASGKADFSSLMAGLKAVAAVDEVTLLLVPDAVVLGEVDLGKLQQAALVQCARLQDRFAVFDLDRADRMGAGFRARLGNANLKYGAAYTPWLLVHPASPFGYGALCDKVFQAGVASPLRTLTDDPAALAIMSSLDALYAESPSAGRNEEIGQAEKDLFACFGTYRNIVAGMRDLTVPCPPGGAMVGIYARMDRERGVWKAPANVVVNGIAGLAAGYSRAELEALAIDPAGGKSINPIRLFPGKGWLVWGARTLAGNDNEWRYISVRRFFNMVEESLRQSTARFVFEPNDVNTWVRVRAMIENYLTTKWQEGALQGVRPDQAFFVRCGVGSTMTEQDVLEGRMIIEVGMAVVRPAEFIILRIVQNFQLA